MLLESFRGRDLGLAFAAARRAMGEDVMILRTEVRRSGGVSMVEVVAAAAEEVEVFHARLQGPPLPVARGPRPLSVALVGPAGAGKSTSLVKLALSPLAFGSRRVGVLTLDTYRVGALEQLGTLTELARLPLEVVYRRDEVPGALRRLDRCDVILIDTPGPRRVREGADDEMRAILAAIRPAEVHLVLPAMMRPELAQVSARQVAVEPTHLLMSKLDEVPDDAGAVELVRSAGYPVRWVSDGPEIPVDLRPGPARVMAALGVAARAGEEVAA